jgi:hypothetical protein
MVEKGWPYTHCKQITSRIVSSGTHASLGQIVACHGLWRCQCTQRSERLIRTLFRPFLFPTHKGRQPRDVLPSVKQYAITVISVSPSSATFLVKAIERFGHGMMQDKSHVAFVDAQSKRYMYEVSQIKVIPETRMKLTNRGTNYLNVALSPSFMKTFLCCISDICMINPRAYLVSGYFLYSSGYCLSILTFTGQLNRGTTKSAGECIPFCLGSRLCRCPR